MNTAGWCCVQHSLPNSVQDGPAAITLFCYSTWTANRNSSTMCYEQVCSTNEVCFEMNSGSATWERKPRLSIKNGEVESHTKNSLIQSCREHQYWAGYDSAPGLWCNSLSQAPSPGWTEMAQQEGTHRLKAQPVSKSLRFTMPKRKACKAKEEEAWGAAAVV